MKDIKDDNLRGVISSENQDFVVRDDINIIDGNNTGAQAPEAINQLTSDLAIQENKMHGMRDLETIDMVRKDNDKLYLMILTVYALVYYRK